MNYSIILLSKELLSRFGINRFNLILSTLIGMNLPDTRGDFVFINFTLLTYWNFKEPLSFCACYSKTKLAIDPRRLMRTNKNAANYYCFNSILRLKIGFWRLNCEIPIQTILMCSLTIKTVFDRKKLQGL